MMERLERSVFVVLCGYLPALAYSLLTLPWVSQELFPSPDHQAGSVDTDNPILPPTDQIETPQETLQCRQPEGQIQMIFNRLILFQYDNMAFFLETTFILPKTTLE